MPNLQKDNHNDYYYEEKNRKRKRLIVIGVITLGVLAIMFISSILSIGDTVTYDTKVEEKTLYPLVGETENTYYIKRLKERNTSNTTPQYPTYTEYYEFTFDKPQLNKKQNRVGVRARLLNIVPTDKDQPYIEIKTKTPKVINPVFPDVFGLRDTRERITYTLYVPYDELDKELDK